MKLFYATFTLCMLLCCDGDYELEKSYFITDPNFEYLPQYSEWGYNTFGAYVNRDPFISNDYTVPMRVISTDGNSFFAFSGERVSDDTEFSITVELFNFNPSEYADLMDLHERTFDLASTGCDMLIGDQLDGQPVQILSGSFQVKRAQYLLVDKSPEEVILSGVFEFQGIYNGETISVTHGRFDVGVGVTNFFAY